MQTKKQSFMESLINILIWYIIAIISQLLIFPIFNINVSINENLLIGLYFTTISLIRSYILRRLFNNI